MTLPLHAAGWASGVLGAVLPASLTAPAPRPARAAPTLVHGASAGEVRAALALRAAVLSEGTTDRWLITTGTAAGLTVGAEARLPRDVPARLAQMMAVVQPEAMLLIEAELWPGLLAAARRASVPVGVAGARLSRRSARRYLNLPRTASRLLGEVAGFAAASAADAERLVCAGARVESVSVCGWLKWPGPPRAETSDPVQQQMLASFAGGAIAAERAPLLILGSVHPGELLAAAQALHGTALAPGHARWLVVPRHAQSVRALRRELGRAVPTGWGVLDARFGGLRAWYQRANAVLVGGGRGGRGTHDRLEAIAAGRRPLFFPHSDDDDAELLTREEAACSLDRRDAAERALQPAPGLYAGLARRHDGRLACAAFLASRGVRIAP